MNIGWWIDELDKLLVLELSSTQSCTTLECNYNKIHEQFKGRQLSHQPAFN